MIPGQADFRPADGDDDELLRSGDRLVRPLPVAMLAAGSELREPLLAAYTALLLVGWFPRAWRGRLVPAAPAAAEA